MTIEFEISEQFMVSPVAIYETWLSSKGHTEMTGSPARIGSRVDDDFEVWDGYIRGRNLALEPGKRIIQTWRTADFEESDADSIVEIYLEPHRFGTRIHIRHSNLPDDGGKYKDGWVDAYFIPLKYYLNSSQ